MPLVTFDHIYLISFVQADEACVPSLFFPTESKKQWFAGLSPLSIVKMKIDENSVITIRFVMGPIFLFFSIVYLCHLCQVLRFSPNFAHFWGNIGFVRVRPHLDPPPCCRTPPPPPCCPTAPHPPTSFQLASTDTA